MKRSLINLTVDLLAAVSLLLMVVTGYILRFPLPPTTNRKFELWGMSRHEWGTIHAWAGSGLMAVLLIHLILHWDWIFSMIRRRFTNTKAQPMQRLRIGLIAVVVFGVTAGIFAWVAETSVRDLENTGHHSNRRQKSTTFASNSTSAPQDVEFQRDIWPLFEVSCIGCHGPMKARANFRVDEREDFFAKADPEPLIVPGDSKKSRLIAIVSGQAKNMKSVEGHILTTREIALLETWINAGANWPEEK